MGCSCAAIGLDEYVGYLFRLEHRTAKVCAPELLAANKSLPENAKVSKSDCRLNVVC